MNARDLLEKARRAADSARILNEAGSLRLPLKLTLAASFAPILIGRSHDVDGACNRGYYAMFDAARAALLAEGSGEAEIPRTHSGLITAFSPQLVKTGRVPVELGRALNRAAEIRLIADYKDEPIDPEQAASGPLTKSWSCITPC